MLFPLNKLVFKKNTICFGIQHGFRYSKCYQLRSRPGLKRAELQIRDHAIISGAGSLCFLLCEWCLEILSCRNLHSRHPTTSLNGSICRYSVFWYSMAFCLTWRNSRKVSSLMPIASHTIKDLQLQHCRLLKKVLGCFLMS